MEIGFAPTQGGHRYEELLEQARYADANGLSSMFLQEHHESTAMSWPDPLTVLSGVATVTEELTLGTAVLLLPLYHPVRLAERGAILDGLSGGRFVLGAALGYRDRDFEILNVDRRKRARIYEEYLTIVSRAWTDEAVTFEGDHYELDAYACSPRPAGDSRPEIWMGGYHPNALDRAARFVDRGLADAWLPGTQPDTAGLVERKGSFDEQLAARSIDPDDVTQPIFRDGVLARTTAEAEEVAVEHVWPSYREQYGSHEGAETSEEGDLGADIVDSGEDPMELVRERAIVGDPDDWIERLGTYEEVLGADHVIVRLSFPGMSHDRVMDQLAVLCEDVLPAI